MPLKPSSCTGCPLVSTGQGFCPDKLVPTPKYTIYGEAPGITEIGVGRPFEGKAGFVLKQWLLRAVPTLHIADEKNHISYKNVLHCLPPTKQSRPYPTGKEREAAEAHCAQYRSPETDAETVILCGEVPQRLFFKAELEAEDASDKRLGRDLKGVMGRIGRTYEKDGRVYVFAPHPAYILRQPALVQHGQRALEIAAASDVVMTPEYLLWEAAVEQLG